MAEVIKRQILKKLTMAAIGCKTDLEKLIDYKKEHGPDSIMPLVTVLGVCSSFRADTSPNGDPFVRLLGQFKAIRVADGATFVSGQCILPGAAPDMVYGALQALGDQGGSVDFVFNIGVRYDATTIANYVYSVEQVVEAKQDDPLKRLEDLASGNAQLEKPAEPATEDGKKTGKK